MGFSNAWKRRAIFEPPLLRTRVLDDEGFDEFGDLLLLPTRQLRCVFKDTLQAAFGRLPFGLWRCDAQQRVDADAEGIGQFGQHFAARRFIPSLPKSNVGLMNTETFGQRLLSQTRRLAQFGQVSPVIGPLTL